MDAKGLALAAGLCVIGGAQCFSRQVSGKGFSCYFFLWLGLAVWLFSGFFTARVLSYHVEKALYLGFAFAAASVALEAFRHPRGRVWLLRFLIISCVVVGALALLQYFTVIDFLLPPFPGYTQRAYSVFGNQNLLGGYMAMGIALLASVLSRVGRVSRTHFFLYLTAFVIMLGALLVSETRTAWLAAVAGGAWGIAQNGAFGRHRKAFFKHRGRILTVMLLIVLLVCAGIPALMARISMTFSDTDVGANSRIWFWAGAAYMIKDMPSIGMGLGNYLYWSPRYQGKALESGNFYHNELHTVHAHSEPLEFLAETGIVGCLFLAVFVFMVFRRNRYETPGVVALTVFACFNTISHSPPHLFAGLLLSGSVIMRNNSFPLLSRKVSGLLVVVVIAFFTVVYTAITLIPSALLNRAEQAHVGGGNPESFYLDALHWPWPNPQAHESYAIALMDASRFDAARIQLEYAAEGLDTGRVHLLQALCAEIAGDREAALYHARACLYRWPGNAVAKSLVEGYNAGEF